ncbi:hypothetical protein [Buchananella hordeovulneris]|nr:hypothetical protein [Buchananella hordeovulneris]
MMGHRGLAVVFCLVVFGGCSTASPTNFSPPQAKATIYSVQVTPPTTWDQTGDSEVSEDMGLQAGLEFFSSVGSPDVDIRRLQPEGLAQYPEAIGFTCLDIGATGWEEGVAAHFAERDWGTGFVLSDSFRRNLEGYCDFFGFPPVELVAIADMIQYLLDDSPEVQVGNVHRVTCATYMGASPTERLQLAALLAEQRQASSDAEALQSDLDDMCAQWNLDSIILGFLSSN